MQIIATDVDGQTHNLEADPGMVLMELLRDEGLAIEAVCGGCCSCATCHVYIDFAAVGGPEETESALLSVADHHEPARSRLSCQIRLDKSHDGLAVTVAPD